MGKPAWCYYDNDPAKGEKYGKLYNWYAVLDPRGLAPEGWHVPNEAEWGTIINYLGSDLDFNYLDGYNEDLSFKGKDNLTLRWINHKTGTRHDIGFPGGYRDEDGFTMLWEYGGWWSAAELQNKFYACTYYVQFLAGASWGRNFREYCGFSVRCLKNN
jgi:uncharacterized protein (TIGR02145 family)